MDKKYFGLKSAELGRLERLQWIVEKLLVLELKGLPFTSRLKFIEELLRHVYNRDLTELTLAQSEQYERIVENNKGRLKDGILAYDIDGYSEDDITELTTLSSDKFWNELLTVQTTIKELFITYVMPLVHGGNRIKIPSTEEYETYLVRTDTGKWEIRLMYKQKDSDLYYQCPLLNLRDSARTYFFEILNGVSGGNIQQCKECNNLFVRRGGAMFCSNKCLYRHHQRERRKKLKDSKTTS